MHTGLCSFKCSKCVWSSLAESMKSVKEHIKACVEVVPAFSVPIATVWVPAGSTTAKGANLDVVHV